MIILHIIKKSKYILLSYFIRQIEKVPYGFFDLHTIYTDFDTKFIVIQITHMCFMFRNSLDDVSNGSCTNKNKELSISTYVVTLKPETYETS